MVMLINTIYFCAMVSLFPLFATGTNKAEQLRSIIVNNCSDEICSNRTDVYELCRWDIWNNVLTGEKLVPYFGVGINFTIDHPITFPSRYGMPDKLCPNEEKPFIPFAMKNIKDKPKCIVNNENLWQRFHVSVCRTDKPGDSRCDTLFGNRGHLDDNSTITCRQVYKRVNLLSYSPLDEGIKPEIDFDQFDIPYICSCRCKCKYKFDCS